MIESYLIIGDEEMNLYDAVDDFLSEERKSIDKLVHIGDNEIHVVTRRGLHFPERVYIVKMGNHHMYEVLRSIDGALWLDGTDLEGYDASLEETNLSNCSFPEEIKWLIAIHINEYRRGIFATISNIRHTH